MPEAESTPTPPPQEEGPDEEAGHGLEPSVPTTTPTPRADPPRPQGD